MRVAYCYFPLLWLVLAGWLRSWPRSLRRRSPSMSRALSLSSAAMTKKEKTWRCPTSDTRSAEAINTSPSLPSPSPAPPQQKLKPLSQPHPFILCRSLTSYKLAHVNLRSAGSRALCVYLHILHRHNTGLCHSAKVHEPNLRVRHDSGGVHTICSWEVTFVTSTTYY